jgi:hypothetical protein
LIITCKHLLQLQILNLPLKRLVEHWLLIRFIKLFLLLNRRDILLINFEKLVISLASLSFLKQRSCSLTGFWLKLIFFSIEIIELDLIDQWLILNIFSLSLEWKQLEWISEAFFWEDGRLLELIGRYSCVSEFTLKVLRSAIHCWFQSIDWSLQC